MKMKELLKAHAAIEFRAGLHVHLWRNGVRRVPNPDYRIWGAVRGERSVER